jgi:hypothetical protein
MELCAQPSQDDWKQAVVGLSSSDSRNIDPLIPQIASIPGISYYGYCSSLGCILILFDPTVYLDEGELENAFAMRKMRIFFKENTTFKMITDVCEIIKPPSIAKE